MHMRQQSFFKKEIQLSTTSFVKVNERMVTITTLFIYQFIASDKANERVLALTTLFIY
jgi:hypothetical protein